MHDSTKLNNSKTRYVRRTTYYKLSYVCTWTQEISHALYVSYAMSYHAKNNLVN